MSGHSKFGPSKAHRWSVCHGSVALEAAIPDEDNVYAFEGTVAHDIASRCATEDKDPAVFLNRKFSSGDIEVTVDEEMVEHVREYLQFVDTMRMMFGGEPLVETRVSYTEEIAGTADLILLSDDGRTLVVIDFKYGQGVSVSAVDNKQAICYALGALKQLGPIRGGLIERVDMHIYQPRARSGPPWRDASMTPAELEEHGAELARHVQMIQAGSNTLVPGDHCKFCKAASTCPKRRDEAQAVAKTVWAKVDPRTLSTDDLLALHKAKDRVVEFLGLVADTLQKRAERGEKVPGYKLVQKLGNRAWTDEQAVVDLLTANGIDPFEKPKMSSPNQVEKKVAKSNRKIDIRQLVTRPIKGTDFVPDSDGRKALPPPADFNG